MRRSPRGSALAWVGSVLLAAACGDDWRHAQSPAPSAPPPAGQDGAPRADGTSDTDRALGSGPAQQLAAQVESGEYRRWPALTDAPIELGPELAPSLPPRSLVHAARGPARERRIRVYVNAAAVSGLWPRRAPFPPGSLLLEELLDAGPQQPGGERFAAMIKHAPPGFAASGGWQFLALGRRCGKICADTPQEDCTGCHGTGSDAPAGAERDGVFATYAPPGREPVPDLAVPYAAQRQALRAYQEALTALALLPSPPPGASGVEPLLRRFYELRPLFYTGDAKAGSGSPSFLESLSDAEFEHLPQALPGLHFGREEALCVGIDLAFFEQLAHEHGDEADRRFLAAYARIYPGGGVWPAYMTPIGDFQGCSNYGADEFIEAYRLWTALARDFPERYTAIAAHETHEVTDGLLNDSCICGAPATFEAELTRFVEIFPDAPLHAKVEARRTKYRAGQLELRAHCAPQ